MHQIPYPYTDKDADWFIYKVAEEKAKCGRSLIWAIRRSDGYLIGGLAFNNLIVGLSHQSSIGYWLAKPYWGRGIMTRAVRVAVQFAFNEFAIVRLYAEVRDINSGSANVLLKAGFVQEGLCRKLWKKGADFWDCRLKHMLWLSQLLLPPEQWREKSCRGATTGAVHHCRIEGVLKRDGSLACRTMMARHSRNHGC
jgi:[ribosomal protein S5]-alanine N-acetyltransferase